MTLKKIILLTLCLFVASLIVYFVENKRGTDLVADAELIKGLDVSAIYRVEIKFKGDQGINMVREENLFVLKDHKGHPASMERLNDLIFNLANIQVREKVEDSASEHDLKNYGLDAGGRVALVQIYGQKGDKLLGLTVGKNYKTFGNYVQKEGQSGVYLSSEQIHLSSIYKDYIETRLLQIPSEDIAKVEVQINGKKGPVKKEKTQDYFTTFNVVAFDDYFRPDESDVRGLNFVDEVKVFLKNKLTYRLSFARAGEKSFLKVHALLDEMPDQIEIKKTDSPERLKEIDGMARAQAEAQHFNILKAPWIYRIDENTAKKILKDPKDIL
ncbi:MAG: hypothetical protein A2X86_20455 [Bdellovibrionales bacterium GWA2_49_15]|nr:MAG: hypothetical protein A2X86_20455 [Bdellovibrionales bacterium GWA2_49_15]HAZ11313.1 hypothetical protein [Bdellovibrionales bacterium]